MIEISITGEDIDKIEAEHNSLVSGAHKHWRFDESRRRAILSWDDVQACPGSGKTTLVAAKLLILASKWRAANKGVCVLTHTNVARDEIITRVSDHPSGVKLTSYPHFIGTIQQFINTFLALPLLRSKNHTITRIDDEACCQQIDKKLAYKTKAYLDKQKVSPYRLKIFFSHDTLDVDIPGFSKESESASYKNLCVIKNDLIDDGLFFYSEMYAFAEALLHEHPAVSAILRQRFPVVFIDEMQDTQKFQDLIINKLFEHDSVILQRFGDPDQAIFDRIGGAEPNESYNQKEILEVIKSSHRFGSDICKKIIGLSYNQLDELNSVCIPERGGQSHTVFLFDDETRLNVLEAFGELVAKADPNGDWKIVKAVGGVEGEGGHISAYWPHFDRNKSSNNPRPQKLIHIVHTIKDTVKSHSSSDYDLLLQGVLNLLRKADHRVTAKDGRNAFFSQVSLNAWLRDRNKREEFRRFLATLILSPDLSAEGWGRCVKELLSLLEIAKPNPEAAAYLVYDGAPEGEVDQPGSSNNVYLCADGREIEVGTIHSVKGETHDATLILETKLITNDLEKMLPFMLDASLKRPTSNNQKAFMRKLYVAGSRPRHLLCIALHKDHIQKDQIAELEKLNWAVVSLPAT